MKNKLETYLKVANDVGNIVDHLRRTDMKLIEDALKHVTYGSAEKALAILDQGKEVEVVGWINEVDKPLLLGKVSPEPKKQMGYIKGKLEYFESAGLTQLYAIKETP